MAVHPAEFLSVEQIKKMNAIIVSIVAAIDPLGTVDGNVTIHKLPYVTFRHRENVS